MKGIRQGKPPSRLSTRISRSRAVRGAAHSLQRYGWPRLQMLLIVSFTGFCGFLASFVLLRSGVDLMWQRYPMAIGVAYLVFLFSLWLWMHWRDLDLNIDVGDWSGSGGGGGGFQGSGGSFGGGGASGSFDGASTALDSASPFEAVGDAVGGVPDIDVGDEGGCLLVLVLIVVVAVLGGMLAGAFYLVSGAPMLMGELLVDAALSFGLYRNLRKQDREYWLFTAVRRTAWIFLLVAVLAALGGKVLGNMVPGARTFGEAIEGAKQRKAESKR